MTARFEPIAPNMGATVHIAADDGLHDGVPDLLFEGLERYNVLVFAEVNMRDATFAEMTARMGPAHDLGVTAEAGTTEAGAGIYRISLDKSDRTQLDFRPRQ